jgi:hypothetical protein
VLVGKDEHEVQSRVEEWRKRLESVGLRIRYLGSLFQNEGEIDRDLINRVNVGRMKWWQVSGTTCDRRMPLKLQEKIYKTIIRPIVLCMDQCAGP